MGAAALGTFFLCVSAHAPQRLTGVSFWRCSWFPQLLLVLPGQRQAFPFRSEFRTERRVDCCDRYRAEPVLTGWVGGPTRLLPRPSSGKVPEPGWPRGHTSSHPAHVPFLSPDWKLRPAPGGKCWKGTFQVTGTETQQKPGVQ